MALLILLPLIFFTACGKVTITQIIKLETDTYISSTDPTNHADAETLRLIKTGAGESRGIVKLPTGKEADLDKELEALLLNPVTLPIAVFVVWIEILRQLLSCEAQVLQAQNLTSATLVLDVVSDQEGSLGGKVGINLLAKSWSQGATWEASHYYSSKGRWTESGGDIDTGFTRVDGTLGSGGDTLEFNVTDYFKTMIGQDETTHYGFLVRSVPEALAEVDLASVQHSSPSRRPRLVTVYTGNCAGSRGPEATAYHLGNR